MKVEIRGARYDFDGDRLSVAEARVLKEHGIPVAAWETALAVGDPDAMVAMAYFAQKRAGESPKWDDYDDLDLNHDLRIVEDEPEEESDDEVDPTDAPVSAKPGKNGGRTPKGGS